MNTIPPVRGSRHQHLSGYLPSPISATDIVYHVGDYPVMESSKVTQALVGATFVQPANVDYQGRKSLMFVFAVCGFPNVTCVVADGLLSDCRISP
jgi:hypothetical protein